MNLREVMYHATKLRRVVHTTLNPKGPGAVRIHMVPPKFGFKATPSVIILNGKDIIPINMSWAVLLSIFIEEVNVYGGREIKHEDLELIVQNTMKRVHKVYRKVSNDKLEEDLWRIISTLCDIAYGKEPEEKIGYMTLGEYATNMKAPHRMDLMVSAMTKEGRWNCNQKCLHCYACGQKQADVAELSTTEWKKIIDRCRRIGIPQLTFTGGEPTIRKDLVELIEYSQWFVTRLNTNGVLLSKSLCQKLYDANLDSVQITLYSWNEKVHNQLVGADNFNKTVEGIKNAIKIGLNVSINTPLCKKNKDYIRTLESLKELGIQYVSCSGLIVTGNAELQASMETQLSEKELYETLEEATKYCGEEGMEISFTSPGWLPEEQIRQLGLAVPTCGACLSNMAISPDGKVVPCQSWLNGDILGDMIKDRWYSIWNGSKCISKRKYSCKMDQKCPLRKN